MEYAESDLKKIIKSNINLELLHIQIIVYNLLCGIKFLHSSNVLHRDLKPANVLINEDCTVKLCDYGLARSLTGVVSADVFLNQADKANPDRKEHMQGAGSSIKLNIPGNQAQKQVSSEIS